MSVDCQWVNTRLGDYLANSAGVEVIRRVEAHAESCDRCRLEIEGYRRVDDRVRSYFIHQMARAERSNALVLRPRRVAAALSGLAMLSLAVWIGVGNRQPAAGLAGIESVAANPGSGRIDSGNQVLKQAPEESNILRAKPDPADPTSDRAGENRQAVLVPPGDGLLVTDAAGYSRALEDYSGTVLVLGVLDPQGQEVFEQAYDAYRGDARLSFVGVRVDVNDLARIPTFPVMTSRGPSLLGTPAGGFTIVTPGGEIYRRGALEIDPLLDAVATALEDLSVTAR